MSHTFQIDEEDRQLVILALAELALSRPGWDYACRTAAEKFGGQNALTMFDDFKKTSADHIKPRYSNHVEPDRQWPRK